MATTKTSKPKSKDAPKRGRPKREAKPVEAEQSGEGAGDEEEDEEEEFKPVKKSAKPAKTEAEPAQTVRRLTPEAKARINALVAKGMPLGEALRAAASWETFVAPVKDEAARLVQGRDASGAGGAPQRRPFEDEPEEPVVAEEADD